MSARPGTDRISIAQALSEQATPTPATVAGRVLAVEGAVMVLVDASGSMRVDLRQVPPPRPGDLVELDLDPATCSALALRLLTPHRADEPFPSPGGEFFHLHHPLPNAGDGAHRATLLARRSRCLNAIRSFFAAAGYLEVETPRRVRLPGLEPHLVAEVSGDRFLITSPEYHMKRLLAGGLERIYSMGPCWRREEQGPSHLGEFTMLEWYRAYSTLEQLMAETEALLRALALELNGGSALSYQGRRIDLARPFTRLTFAEACRRLAGVECAGVTDADELRRRAAAAGLGPFADDDGFDAVASRILVERVEPALAEMGAVFLHAFPAPLSALAQLDPDDPAVAERFELYVAGIELANAFGELTDPEEQRRRLEQDRRDRIRLGAPDHPVDQRFIAALREGMPPSAGIALGVDRLVMLLADAADIRHVVAFPPDSV